MKGKTIIELFDAKTNELVKSVENDNMVTNAFRDMIQPVSPRPFNVYADGGVDITTLFGGLLLFNKELEENADNYYPPTDTLMVGHGAEVTYSGTDLSMGSYNNSESGKQEDGSYKFVWDFNANQANGEIASVCLTSKKGGLAGWGADTELELDDFSATCRDSYIAKRDVFSTTVKDDSLYVKYVDLDEEYAIALSSNSYDYMNTNKSLKFYKIDLRTKKVSPFDTVSTTTSCGQGYTDITEKTIALTDYLDEIGTYNCIAQEDEYMYLLSSRSNVWNVGKCKKILRINLTTYECSVATVENTTEKTIYISNSFFDMAVSGNYLFLPTSDYRICAINMYDNADSCAVKQADGSEFVCSNLPTILGNYENRMAFAPDGFGPYGYNQAYFVTTKDFIARKTGITAYSLAYTIYDNATYYGGMISVKNSNKILKAYRNDDAICLYYPANLLMTINNLESAVTKTSAQSMKVTYVLSPEQEQ